MGAAVAHVDGAAKSEERVFPTSLMWPWIVANFLAFTIGGAIGGGVLAGMVRPHFGENVPVMEAARIQATATAASSAIFWALAGTSQWLILRRAIRAGWWMPVTLLGWAVAGSLLGFSAGGATSTIGPKAGPLPPIVTLTVLPPLFVLLIGGGQWLVLRRDAQETGWWPLVNFGVLLVAGFGGLSVAKVLPFIASSEYPSARALTIVGAVAGPIYAYLTWQFLAQLRRRHPRVVA